MKTIKKAVFPVAGLGSRFLPATKAQPKEMLPIVDKPLIQYAVEEAVSAGITELIFVTGRNKRAIEDHFDTAYELEAELAAAKKTALLEVVQSVIPRGVNCIYIRQSAPLGLGHAVLCAQPVVGDEPFAVLLADDFMDVDSGQASVLAQMAAVFAQEKVSLLAVQDVPRSQTSSYGIVSPMPYSSSTADPARLERIEAIIEKPAPADAPSTLAVSGRYIFEPQIFDYLRHVRKDQSGEIQLTDGIAQLIKDYPVLAYRYEGRRYDCGSKLGYLQACVLMGLKHAEIGPAFSAHLQKLLLK